MRYKIGDLVRIRDDLQEGEMYYQNGNPLGWSICRFRLDYRGLLCTVTGVNEKAERARIPYYLICAENSGEYYEGFSIPAGWNDGMLEPADGEELQTADISYDALDQLLMM